MKSNFGFGLSPTVKYNRSRFNLAHGVKTTMNVGTLYPISIQEVLPGDSFKSNVRVVARVTSAFLKPVIDNCFMDIYHFYVPLRLCFDDAESIFGNPKPSSYTQDNFATVPTLLGGTVSSGTVADYLGLPVGTVPDGISVLPFRAFALIYNQWFRNENTVDEVYINTGSLGLSEVYNNNAWSPSNYLGKLPKVSKKKDYFTSCLPAPQKGVSVPLPLGNIAPVVTGLQNVTPSGNPLKWFTEDGSTFSDARDIVANANTQTLGMPYTVSAQPNYIVPSNLYADLSSATASDVNQFRIAVQLQKMFEKDARYGSRYNEYLLGHFGVISPDSRLQFTEFLGGGRVPIGVQQVAQTSEATATSPLANVGGYSLSNGKSYFNKGFVEHGYVITVACIRQLHTYQQGVSKLFMRTERNDFYDPLFANIGEQPVYTSELFVNPNPSIGLKDDIFGYNEAWAEYRYAPSKITGQLRSNIGNTLDIWHFGDDYSAKPTLSQSFTDEDSTFVDRTLAVPSSSQDNFLCDFWFDTDAIRVMPTYSVPGLVDHH